MIRTLLLLVAGTALAFGQASTAPNRTIVSVPVLPQNFAAAGAMYSPTSSPKITGWATYAHILDQPSATYFFSTEEVVPVTSVRPYTVQTSVRVGLGTLFKQFGSVRLWAVLDGGGTTVGTVTGGSAGGRTCLTAPLRGSAYSIIGCYGLLKSNIVPGTPKVLELGVGKSW